MGELSDVYKYLMTEKAVRFLSDVPTNRTRGNGHELKIRKFLLKTKNHFFYSECGQTLEQVTQRGCKLFPCGDSQKKTQHTPG